MKLSQLLELTKMTDCMDRRNKVFSIQGLTAHMDQASLLPPSDYRKSIAEVYNEASRAVITEDESLDCLSWVADSSNRRCPDNPTWVGELSTNAHQSSLISAAINCTDLQEEWTYDGTRQSHAQPVHIHPLNYRVLAVDAVQIDKVGKVSRQCSQGVSGI